MRTIIAGSRTITVANHLWDALDECPFTEEITEIISGGAQGVDQLGVTYGALNDILVRHFPADWVKFGRSAGPIRNKQMAQYADACIVVWDGKSKGSANMIKTAQELGLRTFVFEAKGNWL